MVTMNWPAAARPMGSCGLPVPGLAPASSTRRPARTWRRAGGRLVVRGPNVMPGYHDKPAETAQALRGGWYHTGDLARATRTASSPSPAGSRS